MTNSPTTSQPVDDKSLKNYWSLFLVQLQGAFSDNLFKFLVVFTSINVIGINEEQRDFRLFLIAAVFSLPFILFSMTSGCLADRFSKAKVITWTKRAEIMIMTIGLLSLMTLNYYMMLGVIFLMSVQSAVFGPAKYSSLPEILPNHKLSWGNGIFSLGTFFGIIAGGTAAGFLSNSLGQDRVWMCGFILIVLAIGGEFISRLMERKPPANPSKNIEWNFVKELRKNLKSVSKNRVLSLAIVGSVYFWLIGALYEPTLVVFGKDALNLDDFKISIMRACMAIGIALGSVAAGYLSGNKIEYGLIPLGSLGIAGTSVGLGLLGFGFIGSSILLTLWDFLPDFL